MVDPERLRRAIHLDAVTLPSGAWQVGEWLVDPLEGCNCPDRQLRGARCKHELRAHLHRLALPILDALRKLAPPTAGERE